MSKLLLDEVFKAYNRMELPFPDGVSFSEEDRTLLVSWDVREEVVHLKSFPDVDILGRRQYRISSSIVGMKVPEVSMGVNMYLPTSQFDCESVVADVVKTINYIRTNQLPRIAKCPFCKLPSAVVSNQTHSIIVVCTSCGATGPTAYDNKNAILKWNRG